MPAGGHDPDAPPSKTPDCRSRCVRDRRLPSSCGSIFAHWASVKTNRFIQSLNHAQASDGILNPTDLSLCTSEHEAFPCQHHHDHPDREPTSRRNSTDSPSAVGAANPSWPPRLCRIRRAELEIIEGVQRGLADVESGRVVSHAQVIAEIMGGLTRPRETARREATSPLVAGRAGGCQTPDRLDRADNPRRQGALRIEFLRPPRLGRHETGRPARVAAPTKSASRASLRHRLCRDNRRGASLFQSCG